MLIFIKLDIETIINNVSSVTCNSLSIVLLHCLRCKSCKGEYPLTLHIEKCLSGVVMETNDPPAFEPDMLL